VVLKPAVDCAQEEVRRRRGADGARAERRGQRARFALSSTDAPAAARSCRRPVRQLLGMFSLETLQVTRGAAERRVAAYARDRAGTGRDGRNLQHFCRELARYFRNLLAGSPARAAASSRHPIMSNSGWQRSPSFLGGRPDTVPATHARSVQDMQFALQPRLHLEIGCSGRACRETDTDRRSAGDGGNPRDADRPAAPRSTPAKSAATAPPKLLAHRSEGAGRSGRIAGRIGLAGACERWSRMGRRSSPTRSARRGDRARQELEFVAARGFSLALQSADLTRTVRRLAGRPMKVIVKVGEPAQSRFGFSQQVGPER
jgi:DNA polymerase-3 subunit gamma/tau